MGCGGVSIPLVVFRGEVNDGAYPMPRVSTTGLRSGWYLPALRLSPRQLAAGGPGADSLPRRLAAAVGGAGRCNAGGDILAGPQLSGAARRKPRNVSVA